MANSPSGPNNHRKNIFMEHSKVFKLPYNHMIKEMLTKISFGLLIILKNSPL